MLFHFEIAQAFFCIKEKETIEKMGLCKCRTVTNLFCKSFNCFILRAYLISVGFQHRKNVCEKCIVSDDHATVSSLWYRRVNVSH